MMAFPLARRLIKIVTPGIDPSNRLTTVIVLQYTAKLLSHKKMTLKLLIHDFK